MSHTCAYFSAIFTYFFMYDEQVELPISFFLQLYHFQLVIPSILMTLIIWQLGFIVWVSIWRLRSFLLDFCNSFLIAFIILSVSITLDEGSDRLFRRDSKVVRSAQALSHVLFPRVLDGERIYSIIFSTSRLLVPSSG